MSDCVVSAADYAKYWPAKPKRGDRVWYWARRSGTRSRKEHGVVTKVSTSHVRVRLDDPIRKHISTITVAISRLNKETP